MVFFPTHSKASMVRGLQTPGWAWTTLCRRHLALRAGWGGTLRNRRECKCQGLLISDSNAHVTKQQVLGTFPEIAKACPLLFLDTNTKHLS